VAERLEEVRARIAGAGADPGRITVVAVTKGFGPEIVAAAVFAGLRDLGENYAQALVEKAGASDLPPDVRWHYLSPVQRNKVAKLAPHVRLWQALDRVRAGAYIARHAPGAEVLIEVNASGDPARPGVGPEAVADLAEALDALGLGVRGLMAVGPEGPPELARPGFRVVAQLAGRLGLSDVSMGMSADLEVAVQEGATMVRIGTALFGARPDA